MKQILHPSVRCYSDGCRDGAVLVEVDPDAGPIYESCEACAEARHKQSEQIVADALLHYGTRVGSIRADVLWAGTSLGWVELTESGLQYRGWIEFAGEKIPATRNTGERDAHGWVLQSTFNTYDEAARAVVLTARNYSKIG